MAEIYRFPIMMAVSVLTVFAVIWLVIRKKIPPPAPSAILLISALVSIGGMSIAKFGANFGLPWTVYYSVPAILTIFLPPLFFKMSLRQAALYILLTLLSAPAIHYGFLFALGWGEYMPFLSGLK